MGPQTNWTPGPWVGDRGFRDAMAGGDHTTIQDDFITVFCGQDATENAGDYETANIVEVHGPNQESNARLIAAAPDLYAALSALHSEMMDCDERVIDLFTPHTIDMMRAAIAKARGL